MRSWGSLLLASAVSACTLVQPFVFHVDGITAGSSGEKDVEAKLGQPAEKLKLADGDTTWFYPRGQGARQTVAVQFTPSGVVRSVEERLEPAVIMKIKPGEATIRSARETLGPPYQTSRMTGFMQRDVWKYLVWDASQQKDVLTLQFSADGVLREKYVVRDPNSDGAQP